ncbi:MAG: alpha/beta fold hydrolase [Desulfobacterales bacterium]|nr:alpha/beta fold hydrolase [Desulfobacterales bacterium]
MFKKTSRLKEPSPPFFLKAENLFAREKGKELFIKKIYSLSRDIPKRGPVVLAPGIASNANLFRIDDQGKVLSLDHNRSFANLLACEGFQVYLYHPGYTSRVHNRYVCQHCKESIYYGRRYKVPSSLNFSEIAEKEVPLVIEFVRAHSQEKYISWIGYSMGGMLIYSYLSEHRDTTVRNVITIGSPVSFNQLFIRIIPYTNMTSGMLGFEETAFLGTISENFVPLTNFIKYLPGWLVRFNLLSFILWNPFNINENTLKTFMHRVVEPIPAGLESSFARMISKEFQNHPDFVSYMKSMRNIGTHDTDFLFFYGQNDMLISPDSVCLTHEIISPNDMNNLIEVSSAGHVDLIIGKKSREKVWIPAVEWLKERTDFL